MNFNESQTERLNEALGRLTYWGDYAGDIVSRFHYTTLLKEYPEAVREDKDYYGQKLELIPGGKYLVEVIRFIAFFDPTAEGYGDYPIYWDDDFYMFEEELAQEEMNTGWWGENAQRDLASLMEDRWEGNTLIPEPGTDEWLTLIQDYYEKDDWDNWEIQWESADSLIVRGWDTEEVADWLLERYAKELAAANIPNVALFEEV